VKTEISFFELSKEHIRQKGFSAAAYICFSTL